MQSGCNKIVLQLTTISCKERNPSVHGSIKALIRSLTLSIGDPYGTLGLLNASSLAAVLLQRGSIPVLHWLPTKLIDFAAPFIFEAILYVRSAMPSVDKFETLP